MGHGKTGQRDGVYYRKDRRGWWVSYMDTGKVSRRERVEAHTRPQALEALSAIKTNVQRECLLGVKQESFIMTKDLFGRYRRHQKARLRPASYNRTSQILDTLERALSARAKDITKNAVAEFVNEHMQRVGAASLTKEIATLKHVLRLAIEWGLLTSNAAVGTNLPKIPQGKTRYLSPAQLKAALTAAPEWMRVPMALAALTGMRRGELLGLKWVDVELEHRRLYLRETKNGDLRIVVLNDLATQALESLAQKDPLVFPGVDPQRLSVETIRLF